MANCKCKCGSKKATVEQAMEYPGVAENKADNDKVSVELEKERTETLNNNPRNED